MDMSIKVTAINSSGAGENEIDLLPGDTTGIREWVDLDDGCFGVQVDLADLLASLPDGVKIVRFFNVF